MKLLATFLFVASASPAQPSGTSPVTANLPIAFSCSFATARTARFPFGLPTPPRVHVFTGVLFEGEPRRIGTGVSVPSHNYKLILVERGQDWKMYTVIVPNQDHVRETIDQLGVSVDEVEERTGLDFFSELPDAQEHELESSRELLTGWAAKGK